MLKLVRRCILLFVFCLSYGPQAFAIAGTGLEYSLAADLTYRQGLKGEDPGNEKLMVREAELMFFGPVDHRWDAMFSLAAHDENSETIFELHELFLESNKIFPRTNIKVGQFFLGIGRLNQIHRHDWSFTSAPLVHKTFLDYEGVFDAGLEIDYLFDTENYWNLTLGVTSGHRFGHSHTAGQKPKTPTHYARLAHFVDFGRANGMEVGLNYLGRTDGNSNRQSIAGLDFISKWRSGRVLRWQLKSEWWYRKGENVANERDESFGGYIFGEHRFNEQWGLGLRTDMFKELTRYDSITEQKLNHIHYGVGPSLTFRNSEFSWIRATFFHEFERVEGNTLDRDTRIELQFVFILGAHPAHAF